MEKTINSPDTWGWLHRTTARWVVAITLLCVALGCQDLAGTPPLPAGIPDPASLHTPAGALGLYYGAVAAFESSTGTTVDSITGGVQTNRGALLEMLLLSGELTDELQPGSFGGSSASYFGVSPEGFGLDGRRLTGVDLSTVSVYSALHTVRAKTAQSIGALEAWAPDSPPALRGHLYTLAGYAELYLAELFCSGVPLSTMDFDGDYTYHRSSTSRQVYEHADSLFTVAEELSTDSARILNLARVGRGRALLNLGLYDSAAAAVHAVPGTFQDEFPVNWGEVWKKVQCLGDILLCRAMTISDHEGVNGFPYVSGQDPRTMVMSAPEDTNLYGRRQYIPAKYGIETTPLSIATWVEARLIEAEASLHSGNITEWTDQLNRLRQTAITPAMPPLSADSTINASPVLRISVMFRERAAWLFLTGHRQGDLRRLVRQYGHLGFDEAHVYPTGQYAAPIPGMDRYGTAVNLPIPVEERRNPLFAGCFDRGA